MSYEDLFVNPYGRTSRAQYIPALITVLAALAFFAFVIPGRTAQFCMLVLLYPAFVLLARRCRDMGISSLLLLLPLLLTLADFAVRLGYLDLGNAFAAYSAWIAFGVSAIFFLWGSMAPSPRA